MGLAIQFEMVILMEMMLDVVMGVMDMEVDKVANIMVNMEVDKVADEVANMEIPVNTSGDSMIPISTRWMSTGAMSTIFAAPVLIASASVSTIAGSKMLII